MVSLFQDADTFVLATSLVTNIDFAVTSADEEDLGVSTDVVILLDYFVFGGGQLHIESVDEGWK